jgi:hypothetical protein
MMMRNNGTKAEVVLLNAEVARKTHKDDNFLNTVGETI